MLSQDRRTLKAIGFVAHLSEANCFVPDCAQLSALLCSSSRCELTQRHASESPCKHPPIHPNRSGEGHTAELACFWCCSCFWECPLVWGGIFPPLPIFAKGNLKIMPFFFFPYECKLSLAFQHSSGMLLFPLPFWPVLFVVKSLCHSVSSVSYCSLAHECFPST